MAEQDREKVTLSRQESSGCATVPTRPPQPGREPPHHLISTGAPEGAAGVGPGWALLSLDHCLGRERRKFQELLNQRARKTQMGPAEQPWGAWARQGWGRYSNPQVPMPMPRLGSKQPHVATGRVTPAQGHSQLVSSSSQQPTQGKSVSFPLTLGLGGMCTEERDEIP